MIQISDIRASMPRVVPSFVLAGLLANGAWAQNFPQITIQPWTEVAPGIRWTQATATSPQWQIRLIEADLSNRNVDLQVLVPPSTSNQTLSSLASASPGVVAAVNAGYFGTGVSFSHIRQDGTIRAQAVSSRPPRAAFGLTHHGSGTNTLDLRINRIDSTGNPTTPAGDATWSRILDALGGGPNLITAGALDVTTATEGFDVASGVDPDNRQPRTALGIRSAERKVLFMTVDGRQTGWSVGMTVTEVARFLQDLGCDAAMNYDGGGSTTAWVNGTVVNRPSNTGNAQRAIWSAWGVVSRQVLDDQDTGDVTALPNAWSQSGNAGFFNTGSRIRSPGSPGLLTFQPNLQRSGRYRVEAWWVADPNRATNTPFQILHAQGLSVLPQNQGTNGSRWNLLGELDFPQGTGGQVRVDANSANGIVSADAVRLTYVGSAVQLPALTNRLTNSFATDSGWVPLGQSGPLLTADMGSRSYDSANTALAVTLGASARGRILGWLEDSGADLPYSTVGVSNYVRARFSMVYSGPGDSSQLSLANQVPNFRLNLRTRGIVTSQLEINHNAATGGSPAQLNLTRELGPSKNPAQPSVYTVDMDPVDVPFWTGSSTEGIQRGFETVVSGADYSYVQGTLSLTDSSISTYPALSPDSAPVKSYRTGGTDFNNSSVTLARLGYSTAEIFRYAAGPNTQDYFNPGVLQSVTIGTEPNLTIQGGSTGLVVNSTGLSTRRIGVADGAITQGNVTPSLRLRVEPNRLYRVSFRLRHDGASQTTPYTRFNARSMGFGYNSTLELLGARGLSGTEARNGLAQVLPGTGNQVPGTTTDGTVYHMIFSTPLDPEIRADVSGTLAQKFPGLSAQPGTGVDATSVRDINFGFTVADSLSLVSSTDTDSAEVANNLVLNLIEIREYPQIIN